MNDKEYNQVREIIERLEMALKEYTALEKKEGVSISVAFTGIVNFLINYMLQVDPSTDGKELIKHLMKISDFSPLMRTKEGPDNYGH